MKLTLFILALIPFISSASVFTSTGGLNIPESWQNQKPILGIFMPHFSAQGIAGNSSLPAESLAVGHHDPRKNGFSWTNLEIGGDFNYDVLQRSAIIGGNIRGAWTQTPAGKFDGELEEAFLTFNLKEIFEFRGGRFYNRFGIQNSRHPHAFEWVDQNLVNGILLGEDSLTTIGGEFNFTLPTNWTSVLTFSIGVMPDYSSHSHEHGHNHEAEFGIEESMFKNAFVTVNWTNQQDYNDFHQFRYGCSGAWGQNNSNRATGLYGIHAQYQWRENGYEIGGNSFRVTTESYLRNWSQKPQEDPHHHGHAHAHAHDESVESLVGIGYYVSAIYNYQDTWEGGIRIGSMSGIADTEQQARTRFSPGITWFSDPSRLITLRLQYNYDILSGKDAHSIWFQTSFAWGK